MRPVLAVLAAVAVCCLSGCGVLPVGKPMEAIGQVGDFSLTERSGRTVQRKDLAGKVWIACFIFTRCAGPCAKVSASMARLQDHMGKYPELVFVTFTVDPEYDTPEVLREYADRHGADPDRWLFLSGSRDEIYRLIREDFKLAVDANEGPARKPGYEVDHSTKLVLVDKAGQIRGFFSGTTTEELPLLAIEAREMIWSSRLPAINALLNGASAVLLCLGYLAVRRGWIVLHKTCMLSALVVSALFLASYLYYHFAVRGGEPTRFQGPELARYTYLTILLSHTVLAVVVAPLALTSAYLGVMNRIRRHKRIVRWTLPIWLYVSVTGVVIYWMLYQLYPPWYP